MLNCCFKAAKFLLVVEKRFLDKCNKFWLPIRSTDFTSRFCDYHSIGLSYFFRVSKIWYDFIIIIFTISYIQSLFFCRRKQINRAFSLWCQDLQVIKYTLHSSQSRSEIFGEACAQANVVDGLILFQVSALWNKDTDYKVLRFLLEKRPHFESNSFLYRVTF